MSEAKFTKGPWYCEPDDFIGGAALTSEAREGMVEIAAISDAYIDEDPLSLGDFESEQQANAHLIAAAPKMYEAMQEFVDRCERGEVRNTRTYEQFKAILAKARGESDE